MDCKAKEKFFTRIWSLEQKRNHFNNSMPLLFWWLANRSVRKE